MKTKGLQCTAGWGVSALVCAIMLGLLPSGDAGAQLVPKQVIERFVEAPGIPDRPRRQLRLAVSPAEGYTVIKERLARDEGEFRRVDGRKVRLLRSLGKVAIRHAPGQVAGIVANLQTGTELEHAFLVDYEAAERDITILRISGLKTLEELNDCIGRLDKALGVNRAVPVYIDGDSGLELVPTEEFILKLSGGAPIAQVDVINNRLGTRLVRRLRGTNDQFILTLPNAKAEDLLATCEACMQDPAILWAEPNFLAEVVKHYTPNDPLYLNQWHLYNTGQTGAQAGCCGQSTYYADIAAEQAWDTTSGDGSIVAVIDDGSEITHEDLSPNLPCNANEICANAADDDANGWVDDCNGWDFYDDDNDPSPSDSNDMHGTSTAGVAIARGNNSWGVAGAAFNAKLMPLKVIKGDYFTPSGMVEALYYAAGRTKDGLGSWRGADVISISLGFSQTTAIDNALAYATSSGRANNGCPIFCSTGNSASGYAWYCLTGLPAGTWYFEWTYSKNDSGSSCSDTCWLSFVEFPDGSLERFNCAGTPSGWDLSPWDNPSWSIEDDPAHAYGTGRYQARAGAIGDNANTDIRSKTVTTSATSQVCFRYWISSESGADGIQFWAYRDGYGWYGPFLNMSGCPTANSSPSYPASHSSVIAVGASTDYDYRSHYSQYPPDLVAPSNGGFGAIWTTDRTGAPGYDSGNYTSTFGGTSASAPLAAGVAALMLSKNACLTAVEVRTLMCSTCEEVGCVTYTDGFNPYYGYGRINANVALEAVPLPPAVPTDCLATPSTICEGDLSTLSANPGAGGDTVEWFTDSCGGIAVPGGALPTVSPTTTTTYYARTTNSATGCVSESCCSVTVMVLTDTDCDDGDLCTDDACVEGVCENTPVDCGDDVCDPDTGDCVQCLVDADCDDGIFCNGAETCVDKACQPGDDPCPGQMCDEGADSCVDCLADADCDDGVFCNGAEACANGTCQPGDDPCPGQMCDEGADSCVDCLVDADCDDGDLCTDDACVEGVCENTPVDCGDDVCDPDTGDCVQCLVDADCDEGKICDTTTNLCVPDYTEPLITAAVSRKMHGTAGTFDINVEAEERECRTDGVTTLVVTFDQDVYGSGNLSDIWLSTGTVEDVTINANEVTVDLSGVPNTTVLTVAFPGIINNAGQPCADTLCVCVLVGDVTGDGAVNIFDLVTVRDNTGQPMTEANCRSDVNGDGEINIFDLVTVRDQTGTMVVPGGVVLIPAGEFEMGDAFSEGNSNELPVHTVYIDAFYMERYEVTKQLWDTVRAWGLSNDYTDLIAADGKAADHPVHSVNWFDCVKWSNARSQMEGRTPCYYMDSGLTTIYKTGEIAPYVNWDANGYRLPTEAEWEKAARGGASGYRFSWSDTDTIQHARANYHSSSSYAYDTSPTRGYHPDFNDGVDPYTSPVGYFSRNDYGLYDMSGNVWEWCNDWWSSAYYSSSPYSNPRGPTSGSYRVRRGGAWSGTADGCRSAYRHFNYPDSRDYYYGFRLALDAE